MSPTAKKTPNHSKNQMNPFLRDREKANESVLQKSASTHRKNPNYKLISVNRESKARAYNIGTSWELNEPFIINS